MPGWWLAISAIAYVSLTLVCISLVVAVFFFIRFLKEVMPKINAIESQVQDVVKKVQELTVHVREVVDNVGGSAKGVVGSAESVAQSASRQFERFSPFVVGALTAIRLVKALKEAREGRSLAKATSKKGIFRRQKPKSLLARVLGR